MRVRSVAIIRQIKLGRLFVGCEGDEPALPYAVKLVGSEAFVYSSDFPHEVTSETCKEEIEELLESTELTMADKQAILAANAERFYDQSARVPAHEAAAAAP